MQEKTQNKLKVSLGFGTTAVAIGVILLIITISLFVQTYIATIEPNLNGVGLDF